ncbi:hypothetical protein QBC47DRAFT_436313 [Echria macrotheca]|uniref:FAD-binding PCMH-type domain-containing protein n=1 Tax=Echria macrotheca TaxID=438768 RepID=A0AAJ0BIK8_9PEZI|nr:hypothetical protein QBC47DRAFT_436313 [Echria macrotheca]
MTTTTTQRLLLLLGLVLSWTSLAVCINFEWETIQLNANETVGYEDISFGTSSGGPASPTGPDGRQCKVRPGDPRWPTDKEWARLNATLGKGALLRPLPAAAVCYSSSAAYDAATCANISAGRPTRYFVNHPLSVLTDWAEGNTCVLPAGGLRVSNRTCTQGGFPVYVVNATTVRDVQIAVNFARNRNLRLVIKNTGHDFGGRNTGAGALSIWTHNLKDFEYLPDFSSGSYTGRAARVSAGVETWEIFNYMGKYNTTMVTPGGDTVGVVGGFIAGGGHHLLSSLYGHGADQVLEFQVVTADGHYRTVTPHQNADLYFAMLGGGGSTYGVLTSAVIKAYPPTPVTNFDIAFEFRPPNTTAPRFPPSNATAMRPSNTSVPITQPVFVNSSETFWTGVHLAKRFSTTVVDAGGTLYSYIRQLEAGGRSYTVTIKLPNKNANESIAVVAPLFADLNRFGIPAVGRPFPSPEAVGSRTVRTGNGNPPGNTRFASRLFPRANWANETTFNATMAAIRATIDAGFTFHGVSHWAPISSGTSASGVGDDFGTHNAISPTWRGAIMHADIFDTGFSGFVSAEAVSTFQARQKRLRGVMDVIKGATPGGGAYVNEGDVLEPDWQDTFFGAYYSRLAQIKRARDPWGLFWAPTTPGSEAWEVESVDGLPTQNGQLCRTGWSYED